MSIPNNFDFHHGLLRRAYGPRIASACCSARSIQAGRSASLPRRFLILRLVTILSLLFVFPVVGSAQDLQGVWEMVEVEIEGGPNPVTVSGSEVQPALLTYTEGYYFLSWVLGTQPRSIPGDDPTDAELVAAWGPFASQAGTYERNGSTVTYKQVVAKGPAAMLVDNPPNSREIITLTADRLVTRGPAANGAVQTFTYRRVEWSP